jgi:5-methylcytosine-specific restriction protein A
MSSLSQLTPGMTLTNNELHDYFKVGNSGGMRKSNMHECLVLICDHSKSLYDDKWDNNGVLHYTGMGSKGKQSLQFSQNKTVTNSVTNNIPLYLFERFDGKQPYKFHGICELASPPYTAQQFDIDNQMRDVCIFPLRLKSGAPQAFSENEIESSILTKKKLAKKFTNEELAELENEINTTPKLKNKNKNRIRKVKAHERSQLLVEYALRRAYGVCQLCDGDAPFSKNNGDPYLEVHHVIWLALGGKDRWYNVVALCPNCHRKMHIVKDKVDIKTLANIATIKLLKK